MPFDAGERLIFRGALNSGDKFDGGVGTDTIVVSAASGGLDLNFTSLDSTGTTGFLNMEAISFNNTSNTSSATFSSSQFGTGKIATAFGITGNTGTQSVTINISSGSTFSASGFTFTTWTGGTDKINLIGSTGDEQITGTTQSDSISGGAGNDIINGGSGDDTMTGGSGSDTFIISANGGSSDAPTATSLGSAGSIITAGGTLTFGNGADIITDFVWGTDLLQSTNGSPASLGLVSLVGSSNTLDLISGVGYYAYGSWSGSVFTISSAWSAQNNDLLYVVGDAGALTPVNSTGYTVLTDLAAGIPAAPSTTATITGVSDNVTPSTGLILSGNTTNDPTPTFSGTLSNTLATGETLLLLNNNSSVLGTASASGTGWSFTPSAALTPGSYSITAVIQDTNGNLSAAGTPFTFTLDIANVAPSVTSYSPSGNSVLRSPMVVLTFNENIFANGGTVTLQSNATDVWVATLTSGQTSGTFTGTFSGNWYIVNNQLLLDNTGSQYTSATNYNVDISYGAVINGQGIPNLAVNSTNTSTAAPATGTGIYFVMNSGQDTAAPTFAATSWANSATWTTISDANLSVGESIDLNLAFNEIVYVTSVNTRINFTNGGYATYLSGAGSSTLKFRYIVAQTDTSIGDLVFTSANAVSAGDIIDSNGVSVGTALNNTNPGGTAIVVDTNAPTTTASITGAVDNVGLIQTSSLASGSTTDDTSLSISGTIATSLVTGETIRIYDGSTYLGTASTSGSTTAWTYTDSRTLTDTQAISYNARVTDAAGNEKAGTTFSLTVDTTAPNVGTASFSSVSSGALDSNKSDALTNQGTADVVLADRHKSETPCKRMGLISLGGQGAVRAWGSYTKPIPHGFPCPAPW